MTVPQPLESREPSFPFWNWIDAAMFAGLALPCLLLAMAITQGVFHLFTEPPSLAIKALAMQFLGYAFWFGSLWLMLKFRYGQPFWRSMAWRIPWPRTALTLSIGPLLVVVVVVLGEVLHTPVIDNSIQRLLRDRLSILLVGFFATTLGPLAEELIFRGFLQPLTIRTCGVAGGIALASVPFALLHGPQYAWSWQHVLLLFLASAVFGVVRWKSGSTAAATLVHATYNLTFYTGFLLQRKELLF